MREIRQVKRYGCSFCRHTGSRQGILDHEPRCFYNPDRRCDLCGGGGYYDTVVSIDGHIGEVECDFCKKYFEFIEQNIIDGIDNFDAYDFWNLKTRTKQTLLAGLKDHCLTVEFVQAVIESDGVEIEGQA